MVTAAGAVLALSMLGACGDEPVAPTQSLTANGGPLGAQLRHAGTVTVFDAPGAGTGAGQGTNVWGINAEGAVVGLYQDGSGVEHGFVRSPRGRVTTLDAPGAGTLAGQGTDCLLYTSDAADE